MTWTMERYNNLIKDYNDFKDIIDNNELIELFLKSKSKSKEQYDYNFDRYYRYNNYYKIKFDGERFFIKWSIDLRCNGYDTHTEDIDVRFFLDSEYRAEIVARDEKKWEEYERNKIEEKLKKEQQEKERIENAEREQYEKLKQKFEPVKE